MQVKKFKKDLMLKFKIISRTCFIFMSKGPILMFVMVAPTLKKRLKQNLLAEFF